MCLLVDWSALSYPKTWLKARLNRWRWPNIITTFSYRLWDLHIRDTTVPSIRLAMAQIVNSDCFLSGSYRQLNLRHTSSRGLSGGTQPEKEVPLGFFLSGQNPRCTRLWQRSICTGHAHVCEMNKVWPFLGSTGFLWRTVDGIENWVVLNILGGFTVYCGWQLLTICLH